MNLIKKLFGKKERSFQEIGFDDLPSWIKARYERISGDLRKNALSIYSDIEKTQKEIKKSVVSLEKAEPEGRFHLKMVKIASSNRDNMAKQVRMLLEKITVPKEADVRTIIDFHENAIQTFGVCLENMMKSYQYTKLVFTEESKKVISDVNSLGRLLNDLIEPINSRKQLLESLEKSEELAGIIRTINSDLDQMEKSLKENEENSVSLKKEIEEKNEILKSLHESESWKQHTVSRNELISLETDAEKKIYEINGIISPLNKALNRLKQLSDSGRHTLGQDQRDALNLCLSCPVEVPAEFFVEFRKIIESGILNLPKADKLLSQVQLAESSLGNTRNEYYVILRDIEQKKDKISMMDIIREEKELNEMLSSLQDKLTTTEKELDISRKQLVLLKENNASRRDELQQHISMIDSNARIV